jgi:hypothetical protein
MAHIAVNHCRIRPIRFHRHDGEAVLLDQAARDGGACAIEFGSTVTCFAQKNDAPVREAIE